MNLILSHFCNIRGPTILFMHPTPIPKEHQSSLLGYMDIQEMETLYEVKTRGKAKAVYYTYNFEIPSSRGRGGVDSLMLAALLKSPLEFAVVESYFKKYINKLQQTPDIYKGLYSIPEEASEQERSFAKRTYEAIYGGFLNVYDQFQKRAEKNAYLDNLFSSKSLSAEKPDPMLFHTLTRAFITAIDARVPDGEILLFDVGGIIADKFEDFFPGSELAELFDDLQSFWRANHFGRIEDLKITQDRVNMRVYDCFECAHMPDIGQTVCKFDEGFFSKLLLLRLKQKFSVEELECYATGSDYCEFEFKQL